MNIEIAWDNASANQRRWWLNTCGWHTRKGTPTRLAINCQSKTWDNLSSAMQNVLRRFAVEGKL